MLKKYRRGFVRYRATKRLMLKHLTAYNRIWSSTKIMKVFPVKKMMQFFTRMRIVKCGQKHSERVQVAEISIPLILLKIVLSVF